MLKILSNQQIDLRNRSRQFANDVLSKVNPAIKSLHSSQERFLATAPFYESLVKEGFLFNMIPQPFGGGAAGCLDLAVMAEEFYAVDSNVSLTAFASMLGLTPIFIAGNQQQAEKYLSLFLKKEGKPIAAFASSEPGGSANLNAPRPAVGMSTRISAALDGWVLNGSKQWISSSCGWDNKGADLLCVSGRSEVNESDEPEISIVILPKENINITVAEVFETVGHTAHITPRVSFNNCHIPKDHLLGSLGQGKQIIESAFTATAALVGIFALGLMRAAFDFTLNYAKTENKGGLHRILDYQAVGFALSDAKMQIESVRSLAYRACIAQDNNEKGARELALCSKVFCSETAVKMITNLMRVVGVDSYNTDLPLSRYLMDALALPLFDGGNMGVRRNQYHQILMSDSYNSLDTLFE
ncbi:acyl-CoA dehydrogenase family protein [Acinetobacter vivianii]|uniref:acyl-CoA dehydrogenase family protein n=1 Tax=Acinetobacter vivianii TaxID=1776742 RepID=UPI002DB9B2A1|nr:acyl-CoA dehydrogenase family protein [Acinetobacter vivianii]MEB6666842.1 acyl-CoA dehydrogenase family protein [Acinetobacter vivianii]